jgi:trafficking protein particle complex subunit 2
MASTACFVIIVSKNDIPIYEAEVGSAPKVCTLNFMCFLYNRFRS